ncbi:MAG TPA: hypothetical protein VKX28_09120 [Xanthobacteraceae bacterium]|nr:hypothetical protein [Xanthobacteraceae bacterium]
MTIKKLAIAALPALILAGAALPQTAAARGTGVLNFGPRNQPMQANTFGSTTFGTNGNTNVTLLPPPPQPGTSPARHRNSPRPM